MHPQRPERREERPTGIRQKDSAPVGGRRARARARVWNDAVTVELKAVEAKVRNKKRS